MNKQNKNYIDDIYLRKYIDVIPISGGVKVDVSRLVVELKQKLQECERRKVEEIRNEIEKRYNRFGKKLKLVRLGEHEEIDILSARTEMREILNLKSLQI